MSHVPSSPVLRRNTASAALGLAVVSGLTLAAAGCMGGGALPLPPGGIGHPTTTTPASTTTPSSTTSKAT